MCMCVYVCVHVCTCAACGMCMCVHLRCACMCDEWLRSVCVCVCVCVCMHVHVWAHVETRGDCQMSSFKSHPGSLLELDAHQLGYTNLSANHKDSPVSISLNLGLQACTTIVPGFFGGAGVCYELNVGLHICTTSTLTADSSHPLTTTTFIVTTSLAQP